MVETIWCRVDTLLGVQVSFSRYGGTTVSECSAIFLGESGRPRTETPFTAVRQGLVRHPAAVEGTATGGQRNGYTDFQ